LPKAEHQDEKHMDAANLLDDPIFVGVMSHKWRTGVSFQGRRCFGALDVFEHAPEKYRSEAATRLSIEEFFFVTVLGKAVDWLKEYKRIRQESISVIYEFLSQLEAISEVHSIIEHDLTYFDMKSRADTPLSQGAQVKGVITYTSEINRTIIATEGYFVAGRLNISEVMTVSDKLVKHLFPVD
jgi:hypothetical protein